MKKMMIVLAMLSYAYAGAQETEEVTFEPKYLVKGYITGYLSPYTNVHMHGNRLLDTYIGDYVQPAFALGFYNKRGNYHEVEVSTIRAKKTQVTEFFETTQNTFEPRGGYITNRTELALRYEYVRVFFKNKKTWVQPSLGIAGMPYYDRYALTPLTTSYFPVRQTSIGIRAFIVPRVAIPLSQRIMLDVNVPICLMETGMTQQNISNPALPANAQNYGLFDLMVLPDYHTARIGLTVLL